ncbi:pantoate--beta-alanine ligase [Bacillus testis]|uniref:pantoate--beta-alanine ligase n=1 Tax=Bacillus testis TaxID=1622072 RepID=UPI00067F66E1|nr:pantoate--beta-alanine ligase [Bacillus testis]
MKIITKIKDLQSDLLLLKSNGKKIGFVPTMGYLHEGHEALLAQARANNDVVVLSIFVNPLQFGEGEDLDTYPRDIVHDEQVAKKHGVDYIFYPTVQEMYPDDMSVTVKVHKNTDVLCGASRPGHFDGVATVLTKLFNIVQPHNAYFGMKDAQQVAVVKGLVKDFNFPIEIIPVDIVREEDGLAKSSRNVYLLSEEREEAPHLYKSLQSAAEKIAEGERNANRLKQEIRGYIEKHTSGIVDYIEIYSYPELGELTELKGQIIIAIAVKFSRARLIDNVTVEIG